MAAWDSADLLAEFNRLANRPASDDIASATKYDRLSKAQDRVVAEIAGVAPYALYPKATYGAYPTLTTADNQVFSFGSDTFGNPLTPIGRTSIYPSLESIPDSPWREGVDYLNEVTQIRIPHNNTYSGTLYWRGITPPVPINAAQQPSLFPIAARVLIAIEAVRSFGKEGSRNPDLVADMQDEWNRVWPRWCLVWRTQFRGGGALLQITGMQLATVGQLQWAT